MLNLLKGTSPQSVPIETILKSIQLLLLLVIAYNSSYLYAIFQELEQANQSSKDIVVNCNTSPAQHAQSNSTVPNQTAQPVPKSLPKQEHAPAKPATAQTTQATQTEEANDTPTTHTVEMLNNSPDGAMVFKPGYIHIKAGDSIEFLPASYGHNVQTPEEVIGKDTAIPSGAEPFKGAMNEKLIVKFSKPGVYLYICNYHYIVGHVGVIQVGNNSHNLEQVRQAGEILKGKIFSHPERVDKYLNMVKVF
ncbi:MAG: hypothetical protein CMF52_04490 [Legionellales bacterium]|nr:hypothetical protein [Legionellales bacterium]HAV94000.1 hypothetical protein [Pseudomonadota bacterium]